MALDMLTASQGGVCARVEDECCAYVPDVHHNVSQALQALASEAHATKHLAGDLLQEWWASLMNGGESLLSWAAVLVLWLLVAVVYSAIVLHGYRTLPSLPMDLRGRHLPINCIVRNPEVVNCRVNEVSLAPSPRWLGN